MEVALLLAAPSLPSAGDSPAESMDTTGAMPEASFKLLAPLTTGVTPHCESSARSSLSAYVQCAAKPPLSKKPSLCRYCGGVSPPCRTVHSPTSFNVSDRWMYVFAPLSAAKSATSAISFSSQVYSRGDPENSELCLTEYYIYYNFS